MLGFKLLDKLNLPTTRVMKEGKRFARKMPISQLAKKANMPVYQMFKKFYGK